MAFEFAYSLDATVTAVVKDLPLDTAANYKTSGTNGVTKGDLVFQSSGLLRRNGATTGAGVGVLEGQEFVGLVAAGQPYAATNTSFTASAIDTTKNPNGVGKVRMDKAAVYRVPVYQSGAVQTAANTHLGLSYALGIDAAGDQKIDLNTVANASVKVVDYSKDGKTVFVTLV